MKPILLSGNNALSAFRVTALLERIRSAVPKLKVKRIEARFVYLLHTKGALRTDVRRKAYELLAASGPFKTGDGFFVTPRKGTISPWSSKASDIFHNCSLTDVLRVERGVHFRLVTSSGKAVAVGECGAILDILHDRMTEGVYTDVSDFFEHPAPARLVAIDVIGLGRKALEDANVQIGLALSDKEIDYLLATYVALKRNPTDVELVMFGQVNSEHCRHKIFNSQWIIDGKRMEESLFGMIRNTHKLHPGKTLVAYKDNSAVVQGFCDEWFEVRRDGSNTYEYSKDLIDMLMKVETHNHPTAISPFPGAATGVGGEIRDEAACGTGGKSKAGLSAFMVSNLRIPGFVMPWEKAYAPFPTRLATPLSIMIDGPIGGAGFGNEFGRPQLLGLFRTYEEVHNDRYRGYHKPIMVAGGMGNIKRRHSHKKDIPTGSKIIQLGGPAMRIGLGGGAASSLATGSNAEDLDFNSVQRGNAEMERRCQEVIDACIALGDSNPILSIHDIGAGGLSNGCPELVSETGGKFELRSIHNEDISMSPMEIWCCEAQERYVLAVAPESLDGFLALCKRERCPVAVIGEATGDGHLTLTDKHFKNKPIDINLGVILGRSPRMLRDVRHVHEAHAPLDLHRVSIKDAVQRVLRLPAVANKTFLITIADRSITGMVARDQMVGPYQTPVADVAVVSTTFKSYTGEAMAMGERTPVALVSAQASGRMAIGEAITNIAATDVGSIRNVKLSANWMCACGEEGEDASLFDTVRAVGMEFCPKLGISIPVGKDSLSMRTLWNSPDGKKHRQVAPLSLVVTAFSTVKDVRRTVTPDIKPGESSLMLIDLGRRRNRLACTAISQVYNQIGNLVPDVEEPETLVRFFAAIQELIESRLIMAYHDRSDGGLFVTLLEMMIAGRSGVEIRLDSLGDDPLSILFSEELGAVIQVSNEHIHSVERVLLKHGIMDITHRIGEPIKAKRFDVISRCEMLYTEKLSKLNRAWSELTCRMQSLRDNPDCAAQEYDNLLDDKDPGMRFSLSFDPAEKPHVNIASHKQPRMAVFREQGINGQIEMAAAFDRAGFSCVDVHMADLLAGTVKLDDFAGLVACGGFSYGDVLGAGSGWAKSILFNPGLKDMFARFFARENTFALGVCNGCQMMAQLKDIIPGAGDWPRFTRNKSEQFEARYVTIQIEKSPSVLLKGMAGSRLGIPVAHGEGFADFRATGSLSGLKSRKLIAARYVDNYGAPTERYPLNPNGSKDGITAITTTDGRVTIMMPHPERAFRSVQMSYRPPEMFNSEEGPWLRLFQNAREFAG